LSYWPTRLLLLLMRLVLPAERAVLLHLEPFRRLLLVLRRAVVAALTLAARHLDDVSHCKTSRANRPTGQWANRKLLLADWPCSLLAYSVMSVTEPAPTVRPPSRIANFAPFSSATGAISSTLTLVLSPGMIISTPSLRCSVPVTSVVRM